jgi:hypothetical protein
LRNDFKEFVEKLRNTKKTTITNRIRTLNIQNTKRECHNDDTVSDSTRNKVDVAMLATIPALVWKD